ncbi:hypothetical protein EDD66_10386 [Mobilisporobacter senegalensis]|uniref:Membrane fusion protein n=1 Tax=Mobilisporobacter senegalensis TaxID=1329262 RepID=A0A3N1XSN4_9FIRM|nr:HlyD family efflux transporter periplasmic adaptor subunit [Mobilisporobacter senegalensis]ROR29151.1 hypothetical protein EDD66_10386 [Mobilisporobacter senegalensis]
MKHRNYQSRKVVKYKRPVNLNIGVIIFGIIFLYIVINVIIYLNKEHLSIYEVSENNIADDNICKGIIIRDETVYNTENAGYVNFYIREGERVAKNSLVYTIDESGELFDTLSASEDMDKLSNEENDKIKNSITSFQKTYSNDTFSNVYNLKYDVDNILYEATNFNMIKNLDSISSDNSFFHKFKINKSGVISYSIDSMEGLTADEVKKDTFSNEAYKRVQLRTDELIERNSPVFKLVTDEKWSIVISLTREQYSRIKEKDRIKVTFIKNDLSTVANIESYKKGDSYFARLDLDNYMIRFLNDRYIDIELTINSASGLKIPKTSIIEKEFYKIPIDYFTTGGDSNKNGLIKEVYSENGELEFKFFPTEIYYEDEEYGYVDTLLTLEDGTKLEQNDYLHNEKNGERYQISEVATLEGVYNVNKGYAVFRRIEKEYENKEYCIVKKDTLYGLSVYDHIVLNGDMIEEQSIIY